MTTGALCGLCKEPIEANKYVRVKPMVLSGERKGRPVYSNAPVEEQGFFCLSHGRGAIEAAVAKEYTPQQGQPVKLLWNPARGDFRMESRRQRVRESLPVSLGYALESVVQTVTMHEDMSKGVHVNRSAPRASLGKGSIAHPDGLRSVVVQDRGGLHVQLGALLGEED